MAEFWESLSAFEKVLWIMVVPASVIFLIETVLTFMGMDAHSGVDADFSGDISADTDGTGDDSTPFQLFTFRNFVNFFLGFGWTGIALYSSMENKMLIVLISTGAGCILVAIVMIIFYQLSRMEESGNMDYKQIINKSGTVYLTIPGQKSGLGKVHVNSQGGLRELDAMTEGEKIMTGKAIKVTKIIEGNILLVETA